MKSFLLVIAFFLYSFTADCQISIKLEDVNKHIGDSVTVCGKVYTARYLENANNKPTFLNIGAAFPHQLLTVVIWGEQRKEWEGKPEELYKGKEICITGKLELYNEKPQLIIKTPKQLSVKE
jgi:DNA/RNA endonuclease YhcR with UshA esterase domain